MLIIEIALGIVLAVLILKYWKQLIGLGIWGIIIVAVVAMIFFTTSYFHNNLNHFKLLIVAVSGLAMLFFVKQLVYIMIGDRISTLLDRLHLSFADLIRPFASGLIAILGLYIFLSTYLERYVITEDSVLGLVIMLVGGVALNNFLKELARLRKHREVKQTYK